LGKKGPPDEKTPKSSKKEKEKKMGIVGSTIKNMKGSLRDSGIALAIFKRWT